MAVMALAFAMLNTPPPPYRSTRVAMVSTSACLSYDMEYSNRPVDQVTMPMTKAKGAIGSITPLSCGRPMMKNTSALATRTAAIIRK